MKKRLLRSRSSFEKPESREEAIMQNILGASNVLEPSESNIEEILKSILYNTPYTKEAEFEIEKILLAIKNNGTYDGEGESRDMKILLAILRESSYTEETESRIEELFAEWLQQRSQIKVLEGVPPLTYTARGLPLINYLIEGNEEHTGTPSPQNPVMPNGTGDMSSNLFYISLPKNDYAAIVYQWTLSGLTPNAQYTCSSNFVQSGTTASIWFGGTSSGTNGVSANASKTMTANSDGEIIMYIKHSPNNAYDQIVNNTTWVMVNAGSTALPYEPYGYKIPISSNGVTTNVYLGEVQTVRQIKKVVFDGTENWSFAGAGTQYAKATLTISSEGTAISTHFVYGSANTAGQFDFYGVNIRFNSYGIADSDTEWKNYLAQQYAAGTPVTVWYVLATPQTGITNEPLMKIGNYADSISMEQTGIEITTINGSNTFDVNTTVKPSNVYIEYK